MDGSLEKILHTKTLKIKLVMIALTSAIGISCAPEQYVRKNNMTAVAYCCDILDCQEKGYTACELEEPSPNYYTRCYCTNTPRVPKIEERRRGWSERRYHPSDNNDPHERRKRCGDGDCGHGRD